MNVNLQNNYKQQFSARCPEIREMQNVMHMINTNFPSFSFSRHYIQASRFEKVLRNDPSAVNELAVYAAKKRNALEKANPPKILNENGAFHVQLLDFPQDKRVKIREDIDRFLESDYTTAEAKSILAFTKINDEFERVRPACYPKNFDDADYLIQFVKNFRQANCGEMSILTYIILKMNGFKNVYVAGLKKGNKSVDHAVCFVCRDGSAYNKHRNNNNTIIVDPWAGITGFYNEIFKNYQGIFKERGINVSKRGKLRFDEFFNLNLSDKDIKKLRLKYPELLYKVKQPSLVFKISDYISSEWHLVKAWFIENFS